MGEGGVISYRLGIMQIGLKVKGDEAKEAGKEREREQRKYWRRRGSVGKGRWSKNKLKEVIGLRNKERGSEAKEADIERQTLGDKMRGGIK